MSAAPVTALYVPGDRPDRFGKAVATGVDVVILDLEDAVAGPAKAAARDNVMAWLEATAPDAPAFDAPAADAPAAPDAATRPIVQVRVNDGDDADLAALAALGAAARAGVELRLPKVESTPQLDRVHHLLPGMPVTALIETALGVERAAQIAVHPAVTRLGLGESDLASDLGTRAPEVLDHVRIRLLLAARSAGLPAPMLSAYPAIGDLDGLRLDTERGRRLGWFGRAAIHPSQLAVIAEVFRPQADELLWAREVIAAVSGGGVARLGNGDMVDQAMAGRARAILERAEH
ncbi:HpcH/HpaI aldolase/citrate lyase family protein [Herbiconiux daphne]|uniref:Aldolase/citrate lyase family protein n=1 Tax=Herbiconiux daphne TaxID=2970914 RepID=A0ABT2H088_9MICO|nr:aldolase/citrate lyase family protein [Herbiconiux daphne]MCS5732806.1 aldolase/citrate lyase family protein [Herbiconiux daphne]